MKAVDKILENPIQLAIGVGLVVTLVYFLARKTAGDAAQGVGGIITGNNAATRGTAYEGAGVVGTVAGSIDKASGGVLSSIGESLGGWFYDVTHKDYDPSTGLQSGAKTVKNGASATDLLWGSIGSVELRSN